MKINKKRDLNNIICHNIKYYRINHRNQKEADEFNKISQEKLAELCEASPSTIRNVESLKVTQSVSITMLDRISEALNIPVWCFLLEHPIPPDKIPKDII